MSAILASASRPLRAMLLGPLCATAPPPDSVAMDGDAAAACTCPARAGALQEAEAYIHGKEIPLEVDEAFQMHRVADFYEVLGLRDACCRFLLNALKPHNCCYLLRRADEVHREPLVQRCMDMRRSTSSRSSSRTGVPCAARRSCTLLLRRARLC